MESIKTEIQKLICTISNRTNPDFETLSSLLQILQNVD